MNYGGYTDKYKEECFQAWYLEGKPNFNRMRKTMKATEDGQIPDYTVLNKWREEYAWDARADELDVRLQEKIDSGLIDIRMRMFQEQAERALELQIQGMEYLHEHGFDSSASAVNAVVKGAELEQRSRGVAESLARIPAMDNKQLANRFKELAERSKVEALPGEVIENIDTEEVQEEQNDT